MSSLRSGLFLGCIILFPVPSSRIITGVVSTHLRSKGQDFPLAYPKILTIEIIALG